MDTLRLTNGDRRTRAGKLRDECVFYRQDPNGTNEFGNPAPAEYVEFLRVRGSMWERAGRDDMVNNVIVNEDSAILRVRYSTVARTVEVHDEVQVRGIRWRVRGRAQMGRGSPRMLEFRLERKP